MSEKTQRRRIVRALSKLDALAVENPLMSGTPDVNYVHGWIELKWMRTWAPNDKLPFRINHFTDKQRRWLLRRWQKGGDTWLMLQVGSQWLLFDGPTAAKYVGHVTEKELKRLAIKYWDQGLIDKELFAYLKMKRNNYEKAQSTPYTERKTVPVSETQ